MRVATTFGKPLPRRELTARNASEPFRILVLADLGGDRPWTGPLTVDRDNLDEVFGRLHVHRSLQRSPNEPPMPVTFSKPDDLHPDRLFSTLDVFAALRRRRARLEDDATFAAEAAAIRGGDSASPPPNAATDAAGPPAAATGTPDASPPPSATDVLSAAVEQTAASQKPVEQQLAEGTFDVDALVRRIVAPYVVDQPDPRKPEFLAAVDAAISDTMRDLLHHPDFQSLEAAWLGVRMLVRRLETDATLQISLMNVSKQQLAEDLCGREDLSGSQLGKRLIDDTSVEGADPWTLVVGDYRFDGSDQDVDLLGRLAEVHAAAGAVFVAGADPSVVGCADLSATPDPDDWGSVSEDQRTAWQAVRSRSAAAHVVLLLPRILARRPYGTDSDPIESFRFEEVPDGRVHDAFLWMNSAFAAATQLGQSFSQHGWTCGSTREPELDNLPVHVFDDAGESVLKPCAEVELPLRAAERLAAAGLTAVLSVRDRDSVRIPSLIPLAESAETVTGRWQ